MKNSDSTLFIGYVEQGIGGSQDPLNPPISVSRNGTVAKWRANMNFIDIRVNDPGLKNNREEFEQLLEKLQPLGIEPILTLPEYIGKTYNVPPAPSAVLPSKKDEKTAVTKKPVNQRPENMVHFRPCYLAIPDAIKGNRLYTELTVEDCLPIIELGAKYGVKKIIVPVSEPGLFIDPIAETKFKKSLKAINVAAQKAGMQILLRNGGISASVFKKIAKEYNCGLAYNVGIGLLESDDIVEVYKNNSDYISVIMFQQAFKGLDKWNARRENMEKALADMLKAEKDYNRGLKDNDKKYTEQVLIRYNDAYFAYVDANQNTLYNMGLFQSGDLNVVPLLREIRKDMEHGKDKYLLMETVPNTRNNDFIIRSVMPSNFTGSF